jgi:hypothetical protein
MVQPLLACPYIVTPPPPSPNFYALILIHQASGNVEDLRVASCRTLLWHPLDMWHSLLHLMTPALLSLPAVRWVEGR